MQKERAACTIGSPKIQESKAKEKERRESNIA